MAEKKLEGVKTLLKSAFEKKLSLSVCLTFFESAEARDLGLMTLLFYCHVFLCQLSCTDLLYFFCLFFHFLLS